MARAASLWEASSAALHEWNPRVSGVTRGCGQSCGGCAHRGQKASRAAPRSTSPRHSAAPPRSSRSALRAWPLQTSRSSLGGRSQRRPALVAGNRPPKPDHSMSAPNPTQHGTMRRSGNTKTGNELGAARSNMSEPYMPTCTTNPAVPAMIKQPTPCKTASGRHAIHPDEGAIWSDPGRQGAVLARRGKAKDRIAAMWRGACILSCARGLNVFVRPCDHLGKISELFVCYTIWRRTNQRISRRRRDTARRKGHGTGLRVCTNDANG